MKKGLKGRIRARGSSVLARVKARLRKGWCKMLVTHQVHTEHEVLKWLALLALAAALTVIFARQIHGTYQVFTGCSPPSVTWYDSSIER